MKQKISMLFTCLLLLTGCSENVVSSSNTSVKRTPEASKTPAAAESTQPSASSDAGESQIISEESPQPDDITGTYQIISYDDGSGNKQTFEKGKDDSILGSSSVVLNSDGSCEFNLPGMSSEGCTWSDNKINASGATVVFSMNGNDLTIKEDDGTYVFEK